MNELEIILDRGGKRQVNSASAKLRTILYTNKFYAFLVFLVAAAVASCLVANFGIVGGALFVATVVALPFVYAIITYPNIGIVVLMVLAYFIMFIARYVNGVPLGTSIDGLEVLFFIGFFIRLKRERNLKMVHGQVSVIVLVWIAYNLLEVCNPSASSILAWVYTVRSVGLLMSMYFIFLL